MKNAIITILVILVLGLGGFILYDKVLKEDKSIKTEEKEQTQKEENITEKEEANADLAYQNYIDNLIKFRKNDLGEYGFVVAEGLGESSEDEYVFKIDKDGNLKSGDKVIDTKVVNLFLIELGQGGDQSLYYIKEDGSLNSFFVPYYISGIDFKIEKLNKKNIVTVVSAAFLDEFSGSYGPVFIDIEGNVSN